MLSRVAENMFWMSRYIERAENISRFIDVNQNMALDDYAAAQWAPLVAITGDQDWFEEHYESATRDNVQRFLIIDPDYPNSILSCVRQARENARTIREVISVDMWQEINAFHHFMERNAKDPTLLYNPLMFLSTVRRYGHAIRGVTDATMSYDETWHFGRLGRLLERADKTSRILDVKYFILLPRVSDVGTPVDTIQWAALLKSASALHMYRRCHGRITPDRVAEFLLLDPHFARSVRFCLIGAEHSLHQITQSLPGQFTTRAEQLMGRAKADLDYNRIRDIIDSGMHQFIDDLQSRFNEIGDAIRDAFFLGVPEPGTSQFQEQQS
jgi:uncharacterized alpha-E superfamily protein